MYLPTFTRVVRGLCMDDGPYENEYIFRVYFFHRNISWITKYWKTWYRTYNYEYRELSVLCIHCLHWQYIMFRETRISGSAVTGCREFTVDSRTAESMLGTKRKSALLSQLNSRPLCSQLFTVTVSCNAAPRRDEKIGFLKQTLNYLKPKTERRRN